jgi:hypothetical protein
LLPRVGAVSIVCLWTIVARKKPWKWLCLRECIALSMNFFVLLLLLPHHTLRLVLSHLEKMSELLDGADAVPVGNCRQQDFADSGQSGEHAVQSLENATPQFLKRLVESDDLLTVCAAYAVKGDY